MSFDFNSVKDLQLQVLRLLGRNLELQQRIAELEQEKAEIPVEAIAAVLVQSIQNAEQMMAAESMQQAHIISQLQATLRGYVKMQSGHLGLSLPGVGQSIDSNQLSSIQITIAQTPALFEHGSFDVLQVALEGTQAAFSSWVQTPGVTEAQDIAARLTHLLAIRQQWGEKEFFLSFQALLEATAKFADVLPQQIPPNLLTDYRTKAQEALTLIQPMIKALHATPDNLATLAGTLKQLTQSYYAILKSVA